MFTASINNLSPYVSLIFYATIKKENIYIFLDGNKFSLINIEFYIK